MLKPQQLFLADRDLLVNTGELGERLGVGWVEDLGELVDRAQFGGLEVVQRAALPADVLDYRVLVSPQLRRYPLDGSIQLVVQLPQVVEPLRAVTRRRRLSPGRRQERSGPDHRAYQDERGELSPEATRTSGTDDPFHPLTRSLTSGNPVVNQRGPESRNDRKREAERRARSSGKPESAASPRETSQLRGFSGTDGHY